MRLRPAKRVLAERVFAIGGGPHLLERFFLLVFSKRQPGRHRLALVSGTNALVFQDKDLEFFTDQRFRAAPCLSTEFLRSLFCNDLGFCALHRKAREILRDPERERAPVLREILKTNVKISARTINPAHGVTHRGSATAREGWGGVETGGLLLTPSTRWHAWGGPKLISWHGCEGGAG